MACRAALGERTRERVPLDWTWTQMNLGTALRALADRGSGTARLEGAVAAFDACLAVAMDVWPPEWVNRVRARREETRAEIERRAAD